MLVDQTVGKRTTMESITVLDNGCLCCTMRDDLVTAIRDIVSTVQERINSGVPNAMIDGILIETTGIADPGPICKTFGMDPIVNRYCKIDGILTVVDAVHFLTQLARDRPEGAVNEPAQQVAFADKVLLNKVDAVTSDKLAETTAAIRGVNAFSSIMPCSIATKPDEVPIGELLALDAFDAARLLTEEGERSGLDVDSGSGQTSECTDPECTDASHGHAHSHASDCSDPGCTDSSHGHEHSHSHSHSHGHESRHDTVIGTMLLELSGKALDYDRFQQFLGDLLAERSVDLYRYKGVMAISQQGVVVRYVLQGVRDMTDVTFSGEWPQGTPVKTQIVLIGRKLEKELWAKQFEECAAQSIAEPFRV
nr:CobW domain-containing protein 2 [Scrippsiella trochoidea]